MTKEDRRILSAFASSMDIAWELGFENDMLISTVTYAKDIFERGPCSESALVKTVLERGISA